MDSEEEEITYKRKKLERIKITDKRLENFAQSQILEKLLGAERLKNFLFCDLSHLYFYHYVCESVNDLNWGCAWRSLQSALRFQLSLEDKKEDISFYNLFIKYGSKDILIEIFEKMSNKTNKEEIIKILSRKEFAPFENSDGWAEPFISQLVLYDYGYKGDLILVNGYPNRSYAPKEVFDKTVNFDEFKQILKSHFSQKNPGPIILDDSCASICVIGIKFNEGNDNVDLMIMDPHDSGSAGKGLYIITLDKNGEFVQKEPEELILASTSIYFAENKPWMVYIPKTE